MLVALYKTKKLLKESVGKRLNFMDVSLFRSEYIHNGTNTVVGPSPYERKWYATVEVEDGIIKRVK